MEIDPVEFVIEVISVLAPLPATPKLDLAPDAVVAPVPPPEIAITGKSAVAIVLNVGVPAEPLGAAKKVFVAWLANVAVKVPEEVTGEFVTEKILGKDKPTLVTEPLPPPPEERSTVVVPL